jgi:hypothetical protein
MLRQEELAFIKAIFTLQLSPSLLRELKKALSRRQKKPVVPAGSRRTTSGGGARAPQRPSGQLAGKRKAKELASTGESFEPSNRRPAPGDGSAPLPASASAVTGEQAATCSRQLVPSEEGVTYAAVLAGTVAPFQPNGSLKPTAMSSDPSEPAVSHETANRRMSSDMSGPISDKPDGTATSAHVKNTYLQA